LPVTSHQAIEIEHELTDVSPRRERRKGFLQPEDGAARVWQYLDLERLVPHLSAGGWLFTRVNLL
jgi:hypothetical protein